MQIQNIPAIKNTTFSNSPSFAKSKNVKTKVMTNYKFNLPQEYQNVSLKDKIIQEELLLSEFIRRPGKVTKEDFNKIKETNPKLIKAADRRSSVVRSLWCMSVTPNYAAKCALAFKKLFDERYGENLYRIISIGTSPACITQLMPSLGCETVFLPISDVGELYRCFDGMAPWHNPKVELLVRYLKKAGVDDKKTNLLFDYVASGLTIRYVSRILTEDLGIDPECCVEESIETVLQDACYDEENELIEESSKYYGLIDNDIHWERVEVLSNVPHYNIRPERMSLDDRDRRLTWGVKPDDVQFKEFDEYSQSNARAFSLSALNQLEKIKKSEN